MSDETVISSAVHAAHAHARKDVLLELRTSSSSSATNDTAVHKSSRKSVDDSATVSCVPVVGRVAIQ